MQQKMWKWHRVIGYVIGLQILLWTLGGVVMSWFDIENVRGEHNIVKHEELLLPDANTLLPIAEIMGEGATSVELKYLLSLPVYDITYAGGYNKIISATTGEVLTPLSGAMATAIAVDDFSGLVDPETNYLSQTNTEYRGTVPVWQVKMHDGEDTRIYVSPTEARVVARRNNVWRLYDFFWMLHIMDYENRSDFNNILVQAASFIALLFTITGGYLIYYRLAGKKRRRNRNGNGS